jgi:hypothetical protein
MEYEYWIMSGITSVIIIKENVREYKITKKTLQDVYDLTNNKSTALSSLKLSTEMCVEIGRILDKTKIPAMYIDYFLTYPGRNLACYQFKKEHKLK